MEYVSCDFCGGNDKDEVVRQTDLVHKTTEEIFSIVRCKGCGLHYLNPRPSREEIAPFYSAEYAFHAPKPRLKMVLISILSFLANSRFHTILNLLPGLSRRLVPYVQPNIPDPVRAFFRVGRILDIGCGSGVTAHFWGEKGGLRAYQAFAEVHGVEIADDARTELASRGVPVYKNLSEVPCQLHFDVIRMNWSLEHVHSPAEYFQFIADRLDQGGSAIITVPNYAGLVYSLAPDCVEVPVHLFHFYKQDIYNYAHKFGLDVVKFQTFSYPQLFSFSGGIFSRLTKAFASPMSISEAYYAQKFLSRLDDLESGNDMLFVLRGTGL